MLSVDLAAREQESLRVAAVVLDLGALFSLKKGPFSSFKTPLIFLAIRQLQGLEGRLLRAALLGATDLPSGMRSLSGREAV
jgi:hypothetical protein